MRQIQKEELLVGDIIHVEEGDVVPADCILISSSSSVKIDESFVFEYARYSDKSPFEGTSIDEDFEVFSDPFLFHNT